MLELQPNEIWKSAPLFRDIPHSRAIVYAVLEGHSPGRVWVDDAGQPANALLFPEGAFYYAAGAAPRQAFLQALPGLLFDQLLPQAAEPEIVLFSFTADWHARMVEVLAPKGIITIQRKMFRFNPEKFAAHHDWRQRLPAGFSLQAIDANLAGKHPAFQDLLEPASQRFGFCLLEGDELACTCSAVFVGGGEAEIDIHTQEAYQGRGLATLTACAFIEDCLRRGLTPNWSCWPEREASWKLALKLGFEELPDVPAVLWAEDL